MKILFFDVIDWDYDVATPLERPLGGSQSCLCYLARELLERGHQVGLVCGTSRPGDILGIPCVSFRTAPIDWVRQFDKIVVLNGPAEICLNLRPHLAPGVPLILWNQHAHDQPATFNLRNPEVRAGWDWIVNVTDLHSRLMTQRYGLDPAKVSFIKNAMGHPFERLFESPEDLQRAKSGPPILAFTSTPFRGLDLLLYVFPLILAEFPDARMHIYSSMTIYQDKNDAYTALYNACRALPGCMYVGSINQPRLAAELRRAAVLAYTNTFAEMACVAVMEAMSAGLHVVTSDLGALSDTMQGHGTLVPPVNENDANLTSTPILPPMIAGYRMPTLGESAYVNRYVQALKQVLRQRAEDPAGYYQAIWEQIQAARREYNWRTRAAEWEAYLQSR
jgi:glycosyltransferase involved in cell wall biosynthesis